MSDNYQAIYDAIRSKISNGDIGNALETVARDMNIPFYFDQMRNSFDSAIAYYQDPSVIFRPKLSIDGDMWCALYGDNLQDGVSGFGKSPALAMQDFNRNWIAELEGGN